MCDPSKGWPQVTQLSADQRSQRGVPPLIAYWKPGGQLSQLDLQEGVLGTDSVKHWTWLIENPSRDKLSVSVNHQSLFYVGATIKENTSIYANAVSVNRSLCVMFPCQSTGTSQERRKDDKKQLLNFNFGYCSIKNHFRGDPVTWYNEVRTIS